MRRCLYFVQAEDENGTNLDLLVWAHNSGEAITLWAEHYQLATPQDCESIKVGQVPGVEGYAPSRVIGWELLNMVEVKP